MPSNASNNTETREAETSLWQQASRLILKVRRRVPSVNSQFARKAEDWCRTRHFLRNAQKQAATARFKGCVTAENYYDFAGAIFPSHQVKSEITAFLRFAAEEKPQTIVEIGTAEGGTHFLLSAAIPTSTLSIALDLHVWNARLLKTYRRPECEMRFLNGSSYDQRTTDRVRDELGNRSIDLLFIDGDHAYAGAKQDFLIYRQMVRPGGLIAFHDIVPDYKTRFGRSTPRWAGDVPVLWRELKPLFAESWEFVEDREQDGLGIGVLRHDPLINVR